MRELTWHALMGGPHMRELMWAALVGHPPVCLVEPLTMGCSRMGDLHMLEFMLGCSRGRPADAGIDVVCSRGRPAHAGIDAGFLSRAVSRWMQCDRRLRRLMWHVFISQDYNCCYLLEIYLKAILYLCTAIRISQGVRILCDPHLEPIAS